jgi:hypothetical protein
MSSGQAGLSMIEYMTLAMLLGGAGDWDPLWPGCVRCDLIGGQTEEETPMTEPNDPPRPRDYALQEELESLHEQEREGHSTPKEQRRAEQLEHRLRADEHQAEAHEREARPRHETDEERARHRR